MHRNTRSNKEKELLALFNQELSELERTNHTYKKRVSSDTPQASNNTICAEASINTTQELIDTLLEREEMVNTIVLMADADGVLRDHYGLAHNVARHRIDDARNVMHADIFVAENAKNVGIFL